MTVNSVTEHFATVNAFMLTSQEWKKVRVLYATCHSLLPTDNGETLQSWFSRVYTVGLVTRDELVLMRDAVLVPVTAAYPLIQAISREPIA